MECASDPCCASEDSELALPALKVLEGGNGESPGAGKSGDCGDGMKTVFLTSRRPLFVGGLRGVGICCACLIDISFTKPALKDCEEAYVPHVRHLPYLKGPIAHRDLLHGLVHCEYRL